MMCHVMNPCLHVEQELVPGAELGFHPNCAAVCVFSVSWSLEFF